MEAFKDGATSIAPAETVELGRVAFASDCAGCHGRLARGTARGPDLIRPEYGPAAVSDDRFRRAVRRGTPAVNGSAGMPAVHGVPERRLGQMTVFLREMQRANGIR